jgi:hypothetical protein
VDFGVPRLGMADRVGQALLNHAVRGQLDACWKRHRLPFDRQVDWEAGLASLHDQFGQLGQARWRRECHGIRRVPQDVDQAAHLGEGVAAGSLHRQQ